VQQFAVDGSRPWGRLVLNSKEHPHG
jgi:hypothetical protein